MAELGEEKKRLEEEAAILEQAATYMSLQTSSTTTEQATLIKRMQDESRVRRSRITNIVRLKTKELKMQ